jgi:hypothetical protein
MVIGRGGNWAKWLGGEMAKGRIGYGRNGEKKNWAKWEMGEMALGEMGIHRYLSDFIYLPNMSTQFDVNKHCVPNMVKLVT